MFVRLYIGKDLPAVENQRGGLSLLFILRYNETENMLKRTVGDGMKEREIKLI